MEDTNEKKRVVRRTPVEKTSQIKKSFNIAKRKGITLASKTVLTSKNFKKRFPRTNEALNEFTRFVKRKKNDLSTGNEPKVAVVKEIVERVKCVLVPLLLKVWTASNAKPQKIKLPKDFDAHEIVEYADYFFNEWRINAHPGVKMETVIKYVNFFSYWGEFADETTANNVGYNHQSRLFFYQEICQGMPIN